MELDAEIDRLYGLPLDEFVNERGELAKRLRADGDREAAERVKGLRKPTAGAWALNQAVRLRTKERDKLLAAGKRLRDAHEALLSGGDPAALRKAMKEERELASSLADAAEVIATETSKGGPALKERVRGTLHAAAVDEDVRDELAAGRVVRERDAVGLGPFGATTVAPPSRAGRRSGAAPEGTGGATERDGAPASGGRRGKRGDAADSRGGKAGATTGSRRAERADAADRRRAERERAQQERAEREQAERERAEQLAAAERSLAAAHTALAKAEAAHEGAAGDLDAARRVLREAEAAERATRKAVRERSKATSKREREVKRLRAKPTGKRRAG